jgi:hypothetical protein
MQLYNYGNMTVPEICVITLLSLMFFLSRLHLTKNLYYNIVYGMLIISILYIIKFISILLGLVLVWLTLSHITSYKIVIELLSVISIVYLSTITIMFTRGSYILW